MHAQHAYYARSEAGLVVCYYRSGVASRDTPYWGAVAPLRTSEEVEELRGLPSPPQLVPTQEMGLEYEAIAANERAAPPSRTETQQLNLNLIADVFSAKERAFASRLKSDTSWVKYKGKLRCELQLSAFELFTLQYYGTFYLPSLLECPRTPALAGNCVLEMDYKGRTLQGSASIWTSPYHIFELTMIELVGEKVHVHLQSVPKIAEAEVKPSLAAKISQFTRKGSMPLDRNVSGPQLVMFARQLR